MSPIIRTLIFTVFVPGFWTVLTPYWMLPHGVRPDVRGAGAAGWLFMAVGSALYFACAFWGFAVRGKGTPLPEETGCRGTLPYRAESYVLGSWICRLGRGGDLSLDCARGVGHRIRGGSNCVCAALRGAGAEAEIRC